MECESKPGCIKAALEIIGDKWSPLILKELAENGTLRFSDLNAKVTGISPRTLAQRLEHLQAEGIMTKKEYCPHPPRCKYSLSAKGRDLVSVLQAMAVWGEKYGSKAANSQEILSRV